MVAMASIYMVNFIGKVWGKCGPLTVHLVDQQLMAL